MKKNKQHIIDTKAKRVFANAIPDEWVLREQTNDYGVDYEVEIFIDGHSTGIIFKIQLKGTESIKYINNNTEISFSMPVASLNYYLSELNVPIFLIHVDVLKKIVYWHNLTIDNLLRERLFKANKKTQQNLVIYLDVNNVLPKDICQMEHAYRKAMFYISARYFTTIERNNFVDVAKTVSLNQDEIDSMKNVIDCLKVDKIQSLIQTGDFEGALKYIKDLLSSTDSTVKNKFQALVYAEGLQMQILKLLNNNKPSEAASEEMQKIYLTTAFSFRSITKKGPAHLKIYSILYLLSSKMSIFARKEFIYYMNYKINQDDDSDSFWKYTVLLKRADLTRKNQLFYMQFKRIINICLKKNLLFMIPHLINRFVPNFNIFLQRLELEGLTEAYQFYKNDLQQLIGPSLNISEFYKSDDELELLCKTLVLISGVKNAESKFLETEKLFSIIETHVKNIEKQQLLKKIIEDGMNKYVKHMQEINKRKEPTLEEEKNIYYRMARSFGVKFEDPNDKIAQIVQIGIDDLDPGRVLKNCVYLFVELTGGGMPAKWLKLPTAGSKRLSCTKHKHAVESLALDNLYNFFKKRYCDKCNENLCHPVAWKWSKNWQLEQNKLYLKKNHDF
ncbi:MAG: DUF4365 domain-containing protein [Candidatus Omnitrophica bacterium]|nr:DUF4365 domain-containing protein [Candidatus Omnitrophota bacterium]